MPYRQVIMKKEDLEHIIRAASSISNEYEIVIIGSQSILGSVSNPPEGLLYSMEADVYPLSNPELADLIDGSIGEESPFHERFGYYAQGVGPETAVLPPGWKDRLVKIQNQNTDLKIGYCLDPLDLAASKLIAFREKDLDFVGIMIDSEIVNTGDLCSRIESIEGYEDAKSRALAFLARFGKKNKP